MNYSFYDEMDELDDILNESTDEEIFIESMEELFEEKATRDEYVMRRFKDKYKYDPKSGTIEVEGQRYKVVLPDKSGIEYIDNPTGFGPKQVALLFTDFSTQDLLLLKYDETSANVLLFSLILRYLQALNGTWIPKV